MMIEQLDLVNLVALHVLLEERHVTRAAKRLGLTQSSMSHRLARLREAFADPLFVRSGSKLTATARAEAMAGPLSSALEALRQAVANPAAFDPQGARFTVTLALPDLLAPLARRLVEELRRTAPQARLRIAPVPPDLSEWLERTAGAMALAPLRFATPSVVARHLGDLRFAVVGRRGHPAFRGRLTVARWLEYPHVLVRIGNERTNVVEEAIEARHLRRVVGLEVPSFLAGLLALESGDLLMNAPTPIVDEVATALHLAVRTPPFSLPKVPFALLFHQRDQRDAAHQFSRDLITSAVLPLFGRGRRSPHEARQRARG